MQRVLFFQAIVLFSLSLCASDVDKTAAIDFLNSTTSRVVRARVSRDPQLFFNELRHMVMEQGWAPNVYIAERCLSFYGRLLLTRGNVDNFLCLAQDNGIPITVVCPTGIDRRDRGYYLPDRRSIDEGSLYIPEFVAVGLRGGLAVGGYLRAIVAREGMPMGEQDMFVYKHDNSLRLLATTTVGDIERFYQGGADIHLVNLATLPERYALAEDAVEALRFGEIVHLEDEAQID